MRRSVDGQVNLTVRQVSHFEAVLGSKGRSGFQFNAWEAVYGPAGDDGYYQLQTGGWTLLDGTWFAGGYNTNYLPWVEAVVSALKNHNAIFAWEIGNELTDIDTANSVTKQSVVRTAVTCRRDHLSVRL